MFDFYLVQIKPDNVGNHATATGKPKRGVARLKFLDCREDDGKPQSEYYDLRGKVATHRQFQNWAKREFGYLRYEVEFG